MRRQRRRPRGPEGRPPSLRMTMTRRREEEEGADEAAATAGGGRGRGQARWVRPRAPSSLALALVALVLAAWPGGAAAYPHYLLNPEGCVQKKLEVGFKMMAYPAILDKAHGTPIKVYRRGQPLLNGSEYRSGESLLVRVEGRSGQYCLEARGAAIFSDGACGGKRITQEQVLGMPMGEDKNLQDVVLVAGLAANEFAPVVITKPFLLRAPGSTPPGQEPKPETAQSSPGDLVLPDSVPRLDKAILLDKATGTELSWIVAPDKTFVDVQVAGKGQTWVSIGVITGKPQMIATPAHRVMLYPNEKGEASMVELKAQRAAGILAVPTDKEIEVLMTESKSSYTLLRFRMHATDGGALQIEGSNTLIFAHGEGKYPEMHDAGDVVTVTWLADTADVAIGGATGAGTAGGGAAVGVGGKDGGNDDDDGAPFEMPGLILLLLPLLALPFNLGPIRNSSIGRWLLQKRLWPGPTSLQGPFRLLKRGVADTGAWRRGEALLEMLALAALVALGAHWYQVGLLKGFDPQRAMAVASGKATITLLMLVTLPTHKASLWLRLCGFAAHPPSHERVLKFHRALGRFTLVAASAHLALSLDMAPLLWAPTRLTPVATAFGLAAYGCLCFLALSAVEVVRRRVFEAFKVLHYLAAVAVFALASLHLPAPRIPAGKAGAAAQGGGGGAEPLAYYLPTLYFSIPLALHLLDLACRAASIIRNAHTPAGSSSGSIFTDARLVALVGATRITVGGGKGRGKKEEEKGVGWPREAGPGQYYRLCVPAISKAEWHPFSAAVAGDSRDRYDDEAHRELPPPLTFFAKDCGQGSWTHCLRLLAAKAPTATTRVLLDGPYGSLSLEPGDYGHLLLVAGGVGITPISSTLHWLRRQVRAGKLAGLQLVELLWAVRDAAQIEWFAPFLRQLLDDASPTASTAPASPVSSAGGSSPAFSSPSPSSPSRIISPDEAKQQQHEEIDLESSHRHSQRATISTQPRAQQLSLSLMPSSPGNPSDAVIATPATNIVVIPMPGTAAYDRHRGSGHLHHHHHQQQHGSPASASAASTAASRPLPFTLRLYVTGGSADASLHMLPPLRFTAGRPDVAAVIGEWAAAAARATEAQEKDAVAAAAMKKEVGEAPEGHQQQEMRKRTRRLAVVACGPEGMLAAARNAVIAHGNVDLHEEAFYF